MNLPQRIDQTSNAREKCVRISLRGEGVRWWDRQLGENNSTYFEEAGDGDDDCDLYFQHAPGVAPRELAPGVTLEECDLDVAAFRGRGASPAPLPPGLVAALQGQGKEGTWGVPFVRNEPVSNNETLANEVGPHYQAWLDRLAANDAEDDARQVRDDVLVVELRGIEGCEVWDEFKDMSGHEYGKPLVLRMRQMPLTRARCSDDGFWLYFQAPDISFREVEIASGVTARKGKLSEPGGEWCRLSDVRGEQMTPSMLLPSAPLAYIRQAPSFLQKALTASDVSQSLKSSATAANMYEHLAMSREAARTAAKAAHEAKVSKWSAADRARALSQPGAKRERLATGFGSLDRATMGGIPVSSLVVIGGAPGGGKTTVATTLAFDWARAGHHVAILAIDESADDILGRFGQMLGHSRRNMFERDPATMIAVADALDGMHILLVDGDDDGVTVESVSAELARRAGGRPSVLVIDSLQRVRPADPRIADARQKINAATDAAKQAAKRHLVIATSELSRSSYGSKDTSKNVNDLAAFKESGGIEYAAQMALVLRNREGVGNILDVTVPKNRLGTACAPFTLELDVGAARVFEGSSAPTSEEAREALALAPSLERVRKTIAGSLGGAWTKTMLANAAGGAKQKTMRAIDYLLEHNELALDIQGSIVRWADRPRLVVRAS